MELWQFICLSVVVALGFFSGRSIKRLAKEEMNELRKWIIISVLILFGIGMLLSLSILHNNYLSGAFLLLFILWILIYRNNISKALNKGLILFLLLNGYALQSLSDAVSCIVFFEFLLLTTLIDRPWISETVFILSSIAFFIIGGVV